MEAAKALAAKGTPIHFFEERSDRGRGRLTQVNSGTTADGWALETAVEFEQRADEGKRQRSIGWRKPAGVDVGGVSYRVWDYSTTVPENVPAATQDQPQNTPRQPTKKKKTPR